LNNFVHHYTHQHLLEILGPAVTMMLHPIFYGYFVRLITKVL